MGLFGSDNEEVKTNDVDKELDALLSEEPGDLDFGLDEGGPRDPVTIAKSTASKVAETYTSPSELTNKLKTIVEESLPSPIRREIDKAKEIKEMVLEPVAKTMYMARRTGSGMLNTLANILPEVPGINSTLRRIAEAIEPEDEDTGYSSSSQESEEDKIKGLVKEAFGETEKSRDEILQERVAAIKELSETELKTRNMITIEVIKDYLLKDQYGYMRKSLELQYKQAFALVDMRNQLLSIKQEWTEYLKAIVKNTSIPDVVKLQNKEMLEYIAKTKMFETGINFIKNNPVVDRLKSGINDMLEQKIISMLEVLDMGKEALESVKEMSDQMPEDQRFAMLAEMFIDARLKSFMSKMFKKHSDSKLMGKLGLGVRKLASGPQYILDNITPDKIKETGIYQDIRGLLKYAFSDKEELSDIEIEDKSLGEAAVFDNYTKKTINTVIPGLLSKIHAELVKIRTGKTKVPELIYDYKTNRFVEETTLEDKLVKELKETRESFINAINYSYDTLTERLLGKDISEEEKIGLLEGLKRLILEGKEIDPLKWLEEPDELDVFGNLKGKILKHLEEIVEEPTLKSLETITRIQKDLEYARYGLTGYLTAVDTIKDMGKTDILDKYGLLSEDKRYLSREGLKDIFINDVKAPIEEKEEIEPVGEVKTPTKDTSPYIEPDIDIGDVTVKTDLKPVTSVLNGIKDLITNKLVKGINNIASILNDIRGKLSSVITANKVKIDYDIKPIKAVVRDLIKNIRDIVKGVKLPEIKIPEFKQPVITLQPPKLEPVEKEPTDIIKTMDKASFTINKALVKISEATVKGLDEVVSSFTIDIKKVFEKDIPDLLKTNLETLTSSIVTKSEEAFKKLKEIRYEDVEKLINSKYEQLKSLSKEDIINILKEHKDKALDKASSLKEKALRLKPVKDATDFIKTKYDKFKETKVFKYIEEQVNKLPSGEELIKYMEDKYGENFVKVEEINEKGEKVTYYMLAIGDHIVTIPIAAFTSPVLLMKVIKEQLEHLDLNEKAKAVTEVFSSDKFKEVKEFLKPENINKLLQDEKTKIKEQGIKGYAKDKFTTLKDKAKKVKEKVTSKIDVDKVIEKLPKQIRDNIAKTEHGFMIQVGDKIITVDKEELMKHISGVKVNEHLKDFIPVVENIGDYIKEGVDLTAEGLGYIGELGKGVFKSIDKHDNIVTKGLKSVIGVGLYGTGATLTGIKNLTSAMVNKFKQASEYLPKKPIQLKPNKAIEMAREFYKDKTPEEVFQSVVYALQEVPMVEDPDKQLRLIKRALYKLDPTGSLWNIFTNDGKWTGDILNLYEEIISMDMQALRNYSAEELVDTLGYDNISKMGKNLDFITGTQQALKNKKSLLLKPKEILGIVKDLKEGKIDFLDIDDKVKAKFEEHMKELIEKTEGDKKSVKGLFKEFLKQATGKDDIKKLNLMDILKLSTVGYVKGSWWLGRNVIRPMYKDMFKTIGNLTKAATKTVLVDVLGFNPAVADMFIKVMEFPFKFADKIGKSISATLEKAKNALGKVWNFMTDIAKKFMSGTWKVVKKALSFVTGRSEDEIEAGKNLIKESKPVKLATKAVTTPLKIAKNIAKFPFEALIIKDEDLWLNKKKVVIKDKVKEAAENIKEVAKKSQEIEFGKLGAGSVHTDKYEDDTGRTTVEVSRDKEIPSDKLSLNPVKFYKSMKSKITEEKAREHSEQVEDDTEEKPKRSIIKGIKNIGGKLLKPVKAVTGIAKAINTKDKVEKVSEADKLEKAIKEESTETKTSVDKRIEKIERMRDKLEKDKEDTALKRPKTSKSESSLISILGLLGVGVGAIKKLVGYVFTSLKFIKKIPTLLGKYFPKLLGKITTVGSLIAGKITSIVSGIGSAISKLTTSIVKSIGNTFGKITDFFKNSDFGKKVTNAVTNVKDKIKGAFDWAKDKAGSLVDKVKNSSIGKTVGKVTDTIGNWFGKIKNTTTNLLSKGWDKIKSAGSALLGKVKNILGKVLKSLASKFPALSKLTPKIMSGLAKAGTKLPLVGLLTSAYLVAKDVMKGNWKLALTDLASGVLSLIPGLGTVAAIVLSTAGEMAFGEDGELVEDAAKAKTPEQLAEKIDEKVSKIKPPKQPEQQKSLWDSFKEKVGIGYNWVKNKTQAAYNWLKEKTSNLKDTAVKVVKTGYEKGKDFISKYGKYVPGIATAKYIYDKAKQAINYVKTKYAKWGLKDAAKEVKAPVNKEELLAKLIKHEGLVLHKYRDSLGYETIGVGHLLDRRRGGIPLRRIIGVDKDQLTPGEAFKVLAYDVNRTVSKLYSKLPWLKEKPSIVQEDMIDMAFNLGVGGLLKFRNTLKALKEDNYAKVVNNLIQSKWYKQVGNRAKEIVSDFMMLAEHPDVGKKPKEVKEGTTANINVKPVTGKDVKETTTVKPVKQDINIPQKPAIATTIPTVKLDNSSIDKQLNKHLVSGINELVKIQKETKDIQQQIADGITLLVDYFVKNEKEKAVKNKPTVKEVKEAAKRRGIKYEDLPPAAVTASSDVL